MIKEILIEIIVPLVSAVFGFFGGMRYEKNKSNQNVKGDNNGTMAGRDINNVHNKK